MVPRTPDSLPSPHVLCIKHSGLVGTTDAEGKSIFAGKAFTSFSNEEEEIVGKVKVSLGESVSNRTINSCGHPQDIPFLLETKLSSLGGIYEKAEPWKVLLSRKACLSTLTLPLQPKVVVSNNGYFITGQNPASARPLAEKMLETLKHYVGK